VRVLARFLATGALVSVLATPQALACGDKFIMGGSESQLERAQSVVVPAKILIYTDPSTDPSSAMFDPELMAVLKEAGHIPSQAIGREGLEKAVAETQFDVILADYGVAAKVRDDVRSKVPTSRVVPVLDRSSRQFLSTAKKDFGVVLNVPASAARLLSAIDKAMTIH